MHTLEEKIAGVALAEDIGFAAAAEQLGLASSGQLYQWRIWLDKNKGEVAKSEEAPNNAPEIRSSLVNALIRREIERLREENEKLTRSIDMLTAELRVVS